jgi:hypothetical protein
LKREEREFKRVQASENKRLAGSGWRSEGRNGLADSYRMRVEFAATMGNDSMRTEDYGNVIH